MARTIRITDPSVQLAQIHARLVRAIQASDRGEIRRARRCYRRALARVAHAARWRERNGHTS